MIHTVLVVEDNQDLRESVVEVLESYGYAAVGARHGQEALEKLSTLAAPPCVIVLDLMMPVMDGQSFRQEQLKRPELAGIPVVIVSAYDKFPSDLQALGAAAYLKKPVRMHDLMRVVRHYCPAPASI